MRRFLKYNGLSAVLILLFIIFWSGQAVSGYLKDCQDLEERNQPPADFLEYLSSGKFWEATAENWESEFLQMGAYVIFAAYLYQKGSAESKDPDEKHENELEDSSHHDDPNAPWPIRKGGKVVLWLYSHSLSLTLFLLFFISWTIHAISGWYAHNEEQIENRLSTVDFWQFITGPEFWFQSFQNWQSEFLSIFCMVVLSIFLRERNSSQSKPVHSPHSQTGS